MASGFKQWLAALLLACAAGGLAACSGGQPVQRAVVTDPEKLAEVGRSIADYQLPPEYQPQFGMQFLGFSLVVFTRDEDQHIMLMQFPAAAGLSQVEMEQELRQVSQRETGELRDMRVVGRQEVTIKGEEVVLVISEGTDAQGQAYRMLSGIFQGRGGPTLLWMAGPVGNWDQAALDGFIASIR
jgi:predicted GH43/DUF377 family glycosyl hydrolase